MGAEITKIWVNVATMLYSIYNLCVVEYLYDAVGY